MINALSIVLSLTAIAISLWAFRDAWRSHRRNMAQIDKITRPEDHIVNIRPHPEGFYIQHPLRERLDGSLFACRLHREISNEMDEGRAHDPGWYRVQETASGWAWYPIEAPS